MKTHMLVILIGLTCFLNAKTSKAENQSISENKSPYSTVKSLEGKGELLFDPKSCQFKILRENVLVSLKDNGFLIEFQNDRTVVGDFFYHEEKVKSKETEQTEGKWTWRKKEKGKEKHDKNPNTACFRSLTTATNNKAKLSVMPNHTNLGSAPGVIPGSPEDHSNGLLNCERQDGNQTTNEIRYYSDTETRETGRLIFIKPESGLSFQKMGPKRMEWVGSNITKKDLKFDEKYRNQCDNIEKRRDSKQAPGRST